ncbi:Auxin-responsive protein SAUR32 [Spatholobus suberectus]|nr:Auxin-responsive protein SAUR32 [Spatholobus suberectus]
MLTCWRSVLRSSPLQVPQLLLIYVLEPWKIKGLCFRYMLGISFKQVPHIHQDGHHDGRQVVNKDIPKGCLKIKVGQGEEQQKITVPVNYLKHPLFVQLLKEAEEEYGFAQKGTITIPCPSGGV